MYGSLFFHLEEPYPAIMLMPFYPLVILILFLSLLSLGCAVGKTEGLLESLLHGCFQLYIFTHTHAYTKSK